MDSKFQSHLSSHIHLSGLVVDLIELFNWHGFKIPFRFDENACHREISESPLNGFVAGLIGLLIDNYLQLFNTN